jgi:hypothetical protein
MWPRHHSCRFLRSRRAALNSYSSVIHSLDAGASLVYRRRKLAPMRVAYNCHQLVIAGSAPFYPLTTIHYPLSLSHSDVTHVLSFTSPCTYTSSSRTGELSSKRRRNGSR